MPLDAEALAADVVAVVKTALSPVLVRLSAVETSIAMTGADPIAKALAPVLERVSAAETSVATIPRPVDLTPILERLAATEATLAVVRDLVRTSRPSEASDFAPEDVAASLDGLLRKALADLETTTPAPTRKRIERDGNAFVVTELREAV